MIVGIPFSSLCKAVPLPFFCTYAASFPESVFIPLSLRFTSSLSNIRTPVRKSLSPQTLFICLTGKNNPTPVLCALSFPNPISISVSPETSNIFTSSLLPLTANNPHPVLSPSGNIA